jgi:pimeloyl-ACP methyl ester carboxylesterase
MSYAALRLDVSADLPADITRGEKIEISAWVFAPDPAKLSARPFVTALLNGGTYDKRYFHVQIPGHPGYSMAEHLRDLGHVVILLDHLGVGESSRSPNQMGVTRQVAAAANHAAVLQCYDRLRAGTLHPSLGPISDFLKVGGGHSMGAFQSITQQAEHATYERLLVLGYTAIGVHLTLGGQLHSADPGPLDFSKPDYALRDRSQLRSTFHWEDVPDAVVAADDALLVEVPYVLSTQSITGGIVSGDAGRITVPVYICLGERDVSPDPHAEPSFYKSSPDVTLHILPRSGHCQTFASTRTVMWDRIDGWVKSIPG